MVLVYFNVDIFIELLKSMLFNPLYNIIYNYPLNTKQKEKKRMIKGTITCGLILASFALTGQSNKAYTLNKEGDTIRQLPRFEQLVGKPGESKTFCYIAESAGVFKYHCSGVHLAGMDAHVLSGMYGIAIVDPANGYKKLMVEKTSGSGEMNRVFYDADALEFTLQFNQLYLDENGNYDMSKMMAHQNTATVINGMQFGYTPNMAHNLLVKGDVDTNFFLVQPWKGLELKQYQSQLLYVENDQHVRLFIENQGNEPVFFHIVGEILDRVTQGNRVQSAATETWLLGGSQNMIVDLVFDEPGVYALVNHDYAAIYSGGLGLFVAGDPFNLNPTLVEKGIISEPVASYAYVLGNPSDAVPPMGLNSIAHPAINIHGLYTDDVASEMQASGLIPLWEVIPVVAEILTAES